MPDFSFKTSIKGLVSIIIPFYNQNNFLAESILSVVGQTYQNWELILINDGSNDESSQIAQTFVDEYPNRIFLYTHPNGENRGASSSRNLGIAHAKGEFVTFLDSDDIFLPDTLKIEIEAFEKNPAADIVCGTSQYWFSWEDKKSKKESDFLVDLGFETGKLYFPPSLFIHNLYAGGRKPAIGCIILKSSFAKKFTLFQDFFKYVSEDQIFWTQASLYGKIYVLKDCLAKYRQHSNSSSKDLIKNGNVESDMKKFSDWLEDYLTRKQIRNPEIIQALEVWQKENRFRVKYKKLISLYRQLLPYRLRHRVRDLIVKWRKIEM